ncbi:MAG: hypothetical protein H7175_11330 [Burkholderiales bacterium]|nr:hypothetical protein [Anaerolineae bacterium]
MAYTLNWADDGKTLLCLTIKGSLTWEQLYEAMDEMKVWAESVDHSVTTITDVRNVEQMPLVNVLKLKPAFSNKARNTQMAILVGLPTFQRAMVNAFMSLYKQMTGNLPVAFVETMEKAEALAAREIAK